MRNKVKFLELDKTTWDSYIDHIEFTNLSQNWEYGVAKSNYGKWSRKNYLIKSERDEDLGIIQVLKKRFYFLDVIRVNRGPLIFANKATLENKHVKYDVLNNLKSRVSNNLCSLFLVAPEIENKKFEYAKLKFFKRKNIIPYGSARMSLNSSEEELLMSIAPKWRNLLKKSHKLNVIVENTEITRESLDLLINFYDESQKSKNYDGVPGSVLRDLALQSNDRYCFNYYTAKSPKNLEVIGVLVSVKNGNTSTYLLGATNDAGREFNANYAMLWASILASKINGCDWYDLGGINENTTDGVRRFKTRLNGYDYGLIGEFWNFRIF